MTELGAEPLAATTPAAAGAGGIPERIGHRVVVGEVHRQVGLGLLQRHGQGCRRGDQFQGQLNLAADAAPLTVDARPCRRALTIATSARITVPVASNAKIA